MGLDMIDPGALPDIVTELDRRGFQCHFHAIGDRAVRNALDAVETARGRNGWTDNRHHIAHIQVVHPHDVSRFRRLGVAANAQALWACNETALVEMTNPFLGPERIRHQYPFGSLLEAGTVLAMGSDWSVSSADVMQQIAVATTRTPPGSSDVAPFLPEERIRLTDALMAFTSGSAWVNHLDDERGVLTSGTIADLAVLDGNPFDAGRPVWDHRVHRTIIAGRTVFTR
jgi:predicted amidohydrolase YtcJ